MQCACGLPCARHALTPPSSLGLQLSVGTDSKCNVLCDKTYDKAEIARFVERIDNDYAVAWWLDGLPAAVRMYEEDNPSQTHYERG